MGKCQDKLLSFLYRSVAGRHVLKFLIRPGISKMAGRLLDSSLSACLIKPFIRANRMDLSDYEQRGWHSFNDFFTRKVKRGARPVEYAPDCLISPCDGAAMVFPINKTGTFSIKGADYTVHKLLRSRKLEEEFEGGMAVILRLSVSDYHRYCYVDDGTIAYYRTIPGVFHTVMPISNEFYPIYHENTREYCLFRSKHFGDMVVMEVGALLVGRIVNDKTCGRVCRGEEKGRFEFGGSTIVLLLKKDVVQWDERLLEKSKNGEETAVKMGEILGVRKT